MQTIFILLLLGASLEFCWCQCSEYCNQPTANTTYGINNSNAGTHNTFFGVTAGRDNLVGNRNSFFGAGTGLNNTFGSDNSFFGRHAGLRTAGFAGDNSFFGSGAGQENKTGIRNSFFGKDAGINSKGNNNAFFGYRTGENTTGLQNCFFGNWAGNNNTSGSHNSFFGENAGNDNSTGEFNSFFGARSGQNFSVGDFNVLMGSSAGFNSSGNNNSFFGSSAGYYMNGDRNIAIGSRAGPPVDSGDVNDRLYIDNHFTQDPLIYGEFDSHFVRINGSFEVTAGLSNPSSRERKTDFVEVDVHKLLSQLSRMPIQQWTYKDRPDEPHIGPVAEDWYATFGLGGSDKQISTIDSDGVALAAIQALTELVQTQGQQIAALERLVNQMKD